MKILFYIPNVNIGNVRDLPLYMRRLAKCVNVAVRCKYVCDNLYVYVCLFGSYRLPACVYVIRQTANKYLISKRLRRDFNLQIKNKQQKLKKKY
jgi:hypothetical protein